MKKIAAAYIRVSTHMQEELSPDAQLRCIRDWGNVHGYYIPDEYVFIDNGISGRKAKKRHDFLRMIQFFFYIIDLQEYLTFQSCIYRILLLVLLQLRIPYR